MQRRRLRLGGGLVVAFVLASGAQGETAPTSPTLPTQPISVGSERTEPQPAAAGGQAAARALPVYRSPLSEYRPYRVDEPLLPWKDANAEVGRLGGHMGHLERPTDDSAR